MKKKVLSFMLTFVMLVSLLPSMVLAETTNVIEQALEEGKTEVEITGTVTFTAANAGSRTDMNGLTIKGADETATLVVEGKGGGLSNVNLENLTVVDNTFYTSENGENAWEFTYLEFDGACTFNNVTFTDGVMFEGNATANNCTFMGHANDSSEYGTTKMYGAWVDNGTATFTDCTFTGTRGLKMHECYGTDIVSVTVDGCTFDSLTEKPGIAVGDLDAEVILTDNTFINCAIYETDSMELTHKNSTIVFDGEYTLTAANAGSCTDMNGLTLKGANKDTAKLIVVGNGGGLANINLADLSVEDQTFYVYENGENAWEFTYLEFDGTCGFDNVTFTDGVMFDGTVTATACTFIGHANDSSDRGTTKMYGAWVNNGTSTFTDCTFTGTRGLKVHEAYGSEVATVTVNGCIFDSLTEKPGIAIGTLNKATVLDVENSTFKNCLQYEADTTGYTFKNVGNTTVMDVATAEELQAAIAATKPVLKGDYTINITADIDLTDVAWVSGTVNGYNGAKTYTVNGNNHTITNLTAPLFEGTWAGEGKLYVNDLTIADSGIVGGADSVGCGAFVGNASATEMVQLKNCHLVNSSVIGEDWTGGLIGYAAGYSNQNDGPVFEYVVIDGCSVKNSTIIGAGSTGAIIGHATGDKWTDITINNCVVEKNIVTCTDDSNLKAGAVLGTVGIGTVHVNATVSGNTVTSNNEAIARIFGRIGSNGGTLDITGGSYKDYWKANNATAPAGDSAKEYVITIANTAVFKIATPSKPAESESTETTTTPVQTTTPAATETPEETVVPEETPVAQTTPATRPVVEDEEEVVIEDEETPLAPGAAQVKANDVAKAEAQVNALVEKIVAGETVEETVVSKETVEKITAAVESGKEIVTKVVAEVVTESAVSAEAKAAVKAVSDVVVAEYIELSVVICTSEGEELGTYNELTESLTFTITIPASMETKGRTFVVIRVHNGEVAVLDTVMNADGTLSFETDRFSTYALAYKEDVVAEEVETEVADTEIVDEAAPLAAESSMGVAPIAMLVVIVLLVAVGIVLVKKGVFKKAE